MKTLALLAAAGVASSAAAQADLVVCVEKVSADRWNLRGQYFGPILGTSIGQIWSDLSVRITGNSPIRIDYGSINLSYINDFSGLVITGQGTNRVGIVLTAPGPLFGDTFDSSIPLNVLSFTYAGAAGALGLEFVGRNTAIFDETPFDNPVNYQNANGTPGALTFEVKVLPAPATAALLGLGGLAAARRRR